MEPVLIIEDSKMFARVVKQQIEKKLSLHCDIAESMAEAVDLIQNGQKEYFAAIIELNLSDSQEGEIVDYVVSNGIPAIVFTAEFSEELRERMLRKQVLDYILKEGEHVLNQLTYVINRLMKNRFIKVLTVDDSASVRMSLRFLLEIQKFQVLEAQNGLEALEIIENEPDIKLVITDYNMPKMDGFQLISELRKQDQNEDLVIIGISSYSKGSLSAKFLKKGANDFVTKPIVKEEFYWRLNQNIEMQEHVEALRDAAIKDYLTGLFNRRYFFSKARTIYNVPKKKQNQPPHVTVAMMDIDHFKSINDTYGHDSGDEALIRLAALMKRFFNDEDIIARFGGEEFCILCPLLPPQQTVERFQEFRKIVEAETITRGDQQFRFTVSIGLSLHPQKDIESAVKRADELLYTAKNSGRNCVRFE